MATVNSTLHPLTPNPPRVVVFDLGGVFIKPGFNTFELPAATTATVTFDRLARSATWGKYECGQISEEECHNTLAEIWGFKPSDLDAVVKSIAQNATFDKTLLSIVSEFKRKHGDSVRIVLMSNIAKPNYEALREVWGNSFWSLFDDVFISSEVGFRKPSPRFYHHVLRALQVAPGDTVFIDDLVENIIAAKIIGIRGFQFENAKKTESVLANLFGDPVDRGLAFLRANARQLTTITNDGTASVKENYSQLLIYEVTGDM